MTACTVRRFRSGRFVMVVLILIVFMITIVLLKPVTLHPKLYEDVRITLTEIINPTKNIQHSRSNNLYIVNVSHSRSNNHAIHSGVEPMAMALTFWEQQGNGVFNIADLQCWAGTVGITKVMEPFIFPQNSNNIFGFMTRTNDELTFRNLLDTDAWNSMSLKNSFALLESPQKFITNAIKKMIYVQFLYKDFGGKCSSIDAIKQSKWYKFLNSKGFYVVDVVCIEFRKEPNNTITQEALRDRIFAKSGYNLTVVFADWHGIRDYNNPTVYHECSFRVSMTGTRCSAVMFRMAWVDLVSSPVATVKYGHVNGSSPLVLNHNLSECVKKFRTEFMSGEDYVVVMMRTERLRIPLTNVSFTNSCMTKLVSDQTKITNGQKAIPTLFFSDTGHHGSGSWGNKAASKFSDKVQQSVGVKHTLSEINNYLEKIMETKNSVLIAGVQREIVAQAKCVLMVGGGKFQNQTLHLFADHHRGEKLCYSFRNKFCESEYISFVYDSNN